MNSPDAEPGYRALFPPDYAWSNRFIPRATLSLPGYRPVRKAAKVRAPLLIQVMSGDVVTPPGPARKAADRAPRGELAEYPGGHFDIYVGEPFERAIADQLAFLERSL
jgi:pimeloyl-ACP methyl ester carboxylesterase